MAGPYVHCLVSKEALKLLDDTLFNRYAPIASEEYLPYVYLGSVSPDYPYLGHEAVGVDPILLEGLSWGDWLHKRHSGDFVKNGLKAVREDADKSSPEFLMKTAWLMGYYSHVITDLVVHAAVYNIVGDYEHHGDVHLICEMTEDSLIYKDIFNKELVGEEFLSILEKCQVLEPFNTDPTKPRKYILKQPVRSCWDDLLKKTYSRYYGIEKPDIDAWHRAYSTFMKVAKGALARNVAKSMSYQKTTDIPDGVVRKYYSAMNIPGAVETGNYRNTVFKKSVDEVKNGWRVLLSAVDDPAAFTAFNASVINADLDTGTVDGKNYVMWEGGKTTDWLA